MRVFLDANVLFSASLGGESFALLWELSSHGRIVLCSSAYCVAEARANLTKKKPDALPQFRERLLSVHVVADVRDPTSALDPLSERLRATAPPAKDLPVFAAAVLCSADVLLTGDTRHFGGWMAIEGLPLRVRTVRAFLLEGP